jgi:hypothetical protein
MTRRLCALLVLLLGLGGLAAGCGRTDRGGDEGSETHWLHACDTSSDCALGECLCGVCTLPCSSVRECPAPLDQCLARAPDGAECAEAICRMQDAGLSPQALEPEPVPELDKLESCDGGRLVDFVRADAKLFPDPAGHLTRVATDGDHGFLLFGQNLDGLVSLSQEGDFVRHLPLPGFEQRAVIDHAVALPDGSLLLGGRVGESQLEHGWIGKLDANWNPLWEQQLELDSVEQTDLVALPDGGAVLMGVRWLDLLEDGEGADDVFIARFNPDGELLWEKRISFNGAHSFADQRGFRLLALTEQRIHVAVPADDGVFLLSSDLDGNIDEARQQTPLSESIRAFTTTGGAERIGVEGLPDGGVAVFSDHDVLILDADAEVRVEHTIGEQEYIAAVRFDPARDELVIAGLYIEPDRFDLPGPWIRALRLDGEISWEARRPAFSFDDDGNLEVATDSAPPLTNAAIDSKGNMLMTGQIGRGLEWAWVGAEACGG